MDIHRIRLTVFRWTKCSSIYQFFSAFILYQHSTECILYLYVIRLVKNKGVEEGFAILVQRKIPLEYITNRITIMHCTWSGWSKIKMGNSNWWKSSFVHRKTVRLVANFKQEECNLFSKCLPYSPENTDPLLTNLHVCKILNDMKLKSNMITSRWNA